MTYRHLWKQRQRKLQPTSGVKCIVCKKYGMAYNLLPITLLHGGANYGYVHKRCEKKLTGINLTEIKNAESTE